MKKLLAAIFFPQALLFPLNKYPEFYEKKKNGDWRFKNKEALFSTRFGKGLKAFGKWWCAWWGFIMGATVMTAMISGFPMLMYLTTHITKMCITDYPNYSEVTFTYGIGENTYRAPREGCWLSKELESPDVREDRLLRNYRSARQAWGLEQCVEFEEEF